MSGSTYAEPTWGRVDPAELARIVVVSPHFDDAAMGAGHVIASHPGTVVVTVFAGRPPSYPETPSEWDALGGFRPGDDVVAVRREEDREAMAILGAEPAWLEFSDHQYLAPEDRPTAKDVSPALVRAVQDARATAVFIPMGLGNPDHVVAHDAGLLVRERLEAERTDPGGSVAWFCYEDQGYKHIPGLLAWRVAKLLRSTPWPTPAIVPHQVDEQRKRDAIWAYRSQIAPLEADHALTERLDGHVPEQHWRLAPPPQGWEALADSDLMADLFDVIGSQRACRSYRPDPVEDEHVEKILWAATHAPSAENRQPWRFVVVRDDERRRALADITKRAWSGGAQAYSASRLTPGMLAEVDRGARGGLATAPVWVVVAAERDGVSPGVIPASVFPAVQNLLLAANGLGLGSVLTTLPLARSEDLTALLALPDHVVPVAVVPIGWPAEPLRPPTRRPVAEVAFRELYGATW